MNDRTGRAIIRGVVLAVLTACAQAGVASAASAPSPPAIVGKVGNSTSLSGSLGITVSGRYAYSIAYWSGELNVIDISNPTAPVIAGSTPSTPSMVAGGQVAVAGHYAFVVAKNRNGPCVPTPSCSNSINDDGSGNSLTIVDVQNPASPTVVGTVTDPNNPRELVFGAYGVAISGNFAYVASQGILPGQPSTPSTSTGSFAVIDITNPAGPTVVANIDNASLPTTGPLHNALDHATAVAVSGNFAYVTAFNSSRLTVVDVSTPSAPTVVKSLQDQTNLGFPNDVAIQGHYAYVDNQTGSSKPQLTIVDITNPLAPVVVGSLIDTKMAGAYRIRVRGNFAVLSGNGSNSVVVVDVSNPAAPHEAAAVIDTTDLAHAIGVDLSANGRYVVATSPRLLMDPSPIFAPYPFQTGGPTVTGTVSMIDLDPSPIGVTIAPASEPADGTQQTSADFTFSLSDVVATVRCSLDQAQLGPCTSATDASYTGLGQGTHTFTVQATDATGTTAQDTYSWTIGTISPQNPPPPPPPPPGGGSAPVATAAPTVAGTAEQGRTLTASSSWSGSPAPAVTYQWERCSAAGRGCAPVKAQTSSRYVLTPFDVGLRLEVLVTATNASGSASARSAPTAVVSWGSGRFATETLTNARTALPGLKLTVGAPAAGIAVRKLTISLPKGASFTTTARRLIRTTPRTTSFTASLRRGVLTITFAKPPRRIVLALAGGALKPSRSRTITLKLTVAYTAGVPARTTSSTLLR